MFGKCHTVKESDMSNSISNYFEAFEELRKINPQMGVQQAQTFIFVCGNEDNPEGVCIKDIANSLGFSQASASRNVAAFTNWTRHKREGPDLLVAVEDPQNRTLKKVSLTSKGREVKSQLEAVLNFGELPKEKID